MTALETQIREKRSPQVLRRRRRVVAPRGNVFWRFIFPVLLVAAAVGVFLLWRVGTKAVLDSTDGRILDVVTDPALPGFEAFVDPTPTMLVAHIDDSGALVGVTVMARTALDDGGALVVLSPDLLIDIGTDVASGQTSVLLGQAYASSGIDQLRALVESEFGFGFTEVIELDTGALGGLMALVEPIPFGLSDNLVQRSGADGVDVWLESGVKSLDGTIAAEVFGFRNPGEFDANRVQRQLLMWNSWFGEIAEAEDLDAATLPFEVGLSPYLRSLSTGVSSIEAVPMDPVQMDPDALPLYVTGDFGDNWISAKALEMVPLPLSTTAIHRPSVRLLDGTGDPDNRLPMLKELVADGEVITVIGNASEFGLATTTLQYHRAEFEQEAMDIADSIGADLVFDATPDLPYDMTVVVGLDRAGS